MGGGLGILLQFATCVGGWISELWDGFATYANTPGNGNSFAGITDGVSVCPDDISSITGREVTGKQNQLRLWCLQYAISLTVTGQSQCNGMKVFGSVDYTVLHYQKPFM